MSRFKRVATIASTTQPPATPPKSVANIVKIAANTRNISKRTVAS